MRVETHCCSLVHPVSGFKRLFFQLSGIVEVRAEVINIFIDLGLRCIIIFLLYWKKGKIPAMDSGHVKKKAETQI